MEREVANKKAIFLLNDWNTKLVHCLESSTGGLNLKMDITCYCWSRDCSELNWTLEMVLAKNIMFLHGNWQRNR